MTDFSIRHYNPLLDLSSLSRMLTEIESIDRDGEDTSEEYLLASLQWPNYHPDKDVWVAELDGQLVGYAVALEQPSQNCTLYVAVHHLQRRKGLGSQLLELIINRAREIGSKSMLVYANERNTASNLFLKKYGFVSVGSSGAMQASATLKIPAFDFPAGFQIKKYSDVKEPRILLAALNDCYLDMWGHQHSETRTEEELRSPRFLKYYAADDILLLFDAQNKVCGICSLKPEGKKDGTGSVSDLLDAPGVLKAYRDQGYQRQLVLAGMQHLRQKDSHTHSITLEFWGESEFALNIYKELGFEMFNHLLTYHKEIA
jgi:mycothiol synthase